MSVEFYGLAHLCVSQYTVSLVLFMTRVTFSRVGWDLDASNTLFWVISVRSGQFLCKGRKMREGKMESSTRVYYLRFGPAPREGWGCHRREWIVINKAVVYGSGDTCGATGPIIHILMTRALTGAGAGVFCQTLYTQSGTNAQKNKRTQAREVHFTMCFCATQ